jgi:hypothetical protein
MPTSWCRKPCAVASGFRYLDYGASVSTVVQPDSDLGLGTMAHHASMVAIHPFSDQCPLSGVRYPSPLIVNAPDIDFFGSIRSNEGTHPLAGHIEMGCDLGNLHALSAKSDGERPTKPATGPRQIRRDPGE